MADATPRHLAVLISGQVRHANVSFFAPNPVLGLSPLQLYVRMRHAMPSPWRAELFLCAERPVSGHPALEHADFAGVWAFNASSQFERLGQARACPSRCPSLVRKTRSGRVEKR